MKKPIGRFEDIESWQLARVFCKKIYEVTRVGEFARDFKHRDQLEGSSGSTMDNIAEGYERNGNGEFCHFLYVAKGSCGESRSQLYRAFDKGYISREKFIELFKDACHISAKLMNLIKSMEDSDFKGPKFKNRPS